MPRKYLIPLLIALGCIVILAVIRYTDLLWLLGVPPLLGLKAWLSKVEHRNRKEQQDARAADLVARERLEVDEAIERALAAVTENEVNDIPLLDKIRLQKEEIEADVASADVENLREKGNKLFGQ